MPVLDETLTWKGAWAGGIEYVEDDAVLDGADHVYICILANTSDLSNRPPNPTYWEPLVAPPGAGTAYGTVEGYVHAVGSTDDNDLPVVADQLIAASRVLDRESGQYFSKATETRIFTVRNSRYLSLNDEGYCPGIADIAGLVVQIDRLNDGSYSETWGEGDYELRPLNADKGPEPRPWDRLVVPSGKSRLLANRVKITGVFGWPSIPLAIEQEIYKIVGIWRKESPEATGRINELDEVIAASPLAQSLVKRWRNAYRGRLVVA